MAISFLWHPPTICHSPGAQIVSRAAGAAAKEVHGVTTNHGLSSECRMHADARMQMGCVFGTEKAREYGENYGTKGGPMLGKLLFPHLGWQKMSPLCSSSGAPVAQSKTMQNPEHGVPRPRPSASPAARGAAPAPWSPPSSTSREDPRRTRRRRRATGGAQKGPAKGQLRKTGKNWVRGHKHDPPKPRAQL